MNRVSFFLLRCLHAVNQQIGHDAYVIREHTPVDLRVEVGLRLPFAPEDVKASLQVWYDGFDAASLLLPRHWCVHTASTPLFLLSCRLAKTEIGT
jgi:hypothetical protein